MHMQQHNVHQLASMLLTPREWGHLQFLLSLTHNFLEVTTQFLWNYLVVESICNIIIDVCLRVVHKIRSGGWPWGNQPSPLQSPSQLKHRGLPPGSWKQTHWINCHEHYCLAMVVWESWWLLALTKWHPNSTGLPLPPPYLWHHYAPCRTHPRLWPRQLPRLWCRLPEIAAQPATIVTSLHWHN